jgi:hypothetical protein
MFGQQGIALHKNLQFDFLSSLPISYGNVFTNTNLTQNSFSLLLITFIIVLFTKNTSNIKTINLESKYWLYTAVLLAINILFLQRPSEFLYFNF